MNGQLFLFGAKTNCLWYENNPVCGEELCVLRSIRIRDAKGLYACEQCHNYKPFVIGGYFDHER